MLLPNAQKQNLMLHARAYEHMLSFYSYGPLNHTILWHHVKCHFKAWCNGALQLKLVWPAAKTCRTFMLIRE